MKFGGILPGSIADVELKTYEKSNLSVKAKMVTCKCWEVTPQKN
jgi:hypothetical protein